MMLLFDSLKSLLTISFLATILLLSFSVGTVDALKSDGVSNQKVSVDAVCGDKLCSEPMNNEEKIQEYLSSIDSENVSDLSEIMDQIERLSFELDLLKNKLGDFLDDDTGVYQQCFSQFSTSNFDKSMISRPQIKIPTLNIPVPKSINPIIRSESQIVIEKPLIGSIPLGNSDSSDSNNAFLGCASFTEIDSVRTSNVFPFGTDKIVTNDRYPFISIQGGIINSDDPSGFHLMLSGINSDYELSQYFSNSVYDLRDVPLGLYDATVASVNSDCEHSVYSESVLIEILPFSSSQGNFYVRTDVSQGDRIYLSLSCVANQIPVGVLGHMPDYVQTTDAFGDYEGVRVQYYNFDYDISSAYVEVICIDE